MKAYLYVATVLAASSAFQTAAFAEAVQKPADAPADALEEIVITAERRSQDVLKTPISVIAMTGDTLKDRGITDINSLQSQVPSVSFVDYGTVKFLNIRGVGISEGAPNQTVGVAVYWDGAYVAREFVFGDSFFDVADIEVLRGPQGTYTGQNASGGAVFVNSVRPDFNGTSGFADLTLGNLEEKKIAAGVTTQLSDTVAVRVSGQLESKNSAFDNLGPTGVAGPVKYANQPGDIRSLIGRAQLLFRPSDDLDFLLIHQYSDRTSDGLPTQSFANTTVGNRTLAYDINQALNTSYNRTTGIINYTGIDAFKVRLTGAYQTTDQLSIVDNNYGNDNGVAPGGSASEIIIHDRYYETELNLISPDDQFLTWVAGATYLNYRQPGITVPSITATEPFGSGLYIFSDSVRRNESVFAELGHKVTPKLEIKVGGRYSWDQAGFAPSYLQPIGTSGFQIPLTPGIKDFSEFTGRVVVDYQLTDGHFLYATVSKGYKPGGTTAFGDAYNSETVINYETGWKARMFDGALTTSLSVFDMDYKNFQTTYTPDINNPATAITTNVNGTRIKGVEGQLGINTGGFHADASFSVLDAKYGPLSIVNPVGLFGNGLPAVPMVANLDGRTIPFAAKFSGTAGIGYDIPIGNGALAPSARVTYQGSQWVNYFQASYDRIPSHTLVSARVTYKPDAKWSIAAYVDNLLNKNYIANVQASTDGIGEYLLGQPREFGVSLSYKF